jgi:transposase InsO family protein
MCTCSLAFPTWKNDLQSEPSDAGAREIAMLDDMKFEELMSRRGIDERAITVIQVIRNSPPSRLVNSSDKNMGVRYASKKMGMVIQTESHTCELHYVILWEHDDGVHEFYDQCPPLKLSYDSINKETGKKRRAGHPHTPDFFKISDDFIGWVECKSEVWLIAQQSNPTVSNYYYDQETQRWRNGALEEYAASYGLQFEIKVDVELDELFVRNINFLSDYLDEEYPAICQDDRSQILGIFNGQSSTLLSQLIQLLPVGKSHCIYKMIADDELFVNLEVDLLAAPHFTQVYCDKFHAESYGRLRASNNSKHACNYSFHILNFEVGSQFLWDGQPWKIINIGNTEFSARAIDGEKGRDILTFNVEQARKLVAEGRWKVPEDQSPFEDDEATQIFNRSSEADIVAGNERYDLVIRHENGERVDVPSRTMRLWKQKLRDALAGVGNGYVGLISRTALRGNRTRRVSDQVLELIDSVLSEHLLGDSPKTISACYHILNAQCQTKTLDCPSEKTFRQEIKRRVQDHEIIKARHGPKAAYATSEFVYYRLENSVPQHGDRAFEVAHIDHTQLDIQLVDSATGENLGKPWLTIMMDAFSRMILAYVLTFDEPSYRSCMLIVRDCIRRHNRIPDFLVVDKGPEFKSNYWQGLVAKLSSHLKIRPTAQGRYGSVIERFFGVANKQFVHQLIGNNTALQNARMLSSSHDPRKLAIWTLPELDASLSEYIFDTYCLISHSSLGSSPKRVFDNSILKTGVRATRVIQPTNALDLACLPETKNGPKRIHQGRGIKLFHEHYFHPRFSEPALINRKVPVKFDPFNLGHIYAQIEGEWLLCSCPKDSQFKWMSEKQLKITWTEYLGMFNGRGERNKSKSAQLGRFLLNVQERQRVMQQKQRDREAAMKNRSSEGPGESNVLPTAQALLPNLELVLDKQTYGEFT